MNRQAFGRVRKKKDGQTGGGGELAATFSANSRPSNSRVTYVENE